MLQVSLGVTRTGGIWNDQVTGKVLVGRDKLGGWDEVGLGQEVHEEKDAEGGTARQEEDSKPKGEHGGGWWGSGRCGGTAEAVQRNQRRFALPSIIPFTATSDEHFTFSISS